MCVWRGGGSAKGAHKDVIAWQVKKGKWTAEEDRLIATLHSVFKHTHTHTVALSKESMLSPHVCHFGYSNSAIDGRPLRNESLAGQVGVVYCCRMFDDTQTHSTTTDTDNAIKNRFYSTMRRIMRKSQQATGEY